MPLTPKSRPTSEADIPLLTNFSASRFYSAAKCLLVFAISAPVHLDTLTQCPENRQQSTHKAYIWSYGSTQFDTLPLVLYDFTESRAGHHARTFLGKWSGKLVCDDYSGYKAMFGGHVTEVGCMAHARRKFEELKDTERSELAAEALLLYGLLYDIEANAREQKLDAPGRQRFRQQHARPVIDHLHDWLTRQRMKVPDGSPIAKAINYSLGRWPALTQYIDDGDLPIDNNWLENRIRPISVGRKNWLFAGSLRAGQRAAVIMSLIQSAKLCGHEPYRYLKDVLQRLPTHPSSRLEELLPHRWSPPLTNN